MAAAARSVYFVPGGRGGRRGILCNAVVVVVVVRGWRVFMLFWSRFFLICFRRRSDGGGWGSGDVVGETRAEKRPRGLWHPSASQEERGERERTGQDRTGQERREGSFFFFSRVNWSVSIGICCGILRASGRFFRFLCGGDQVEADKVHGGVRRGGGGW